MAIGSSSCGICSTRPSRWRRRRYAFLGDVATGEPALANELRGLLEHDEDAAAAERAIVDRVLPAAVRLARRRSDHTSWPDIPGYRLLREVGHGGMGSVVLADRDDAQFRHQVAIKLVRGFPSGKLLERFRRERELLATLRHPNIARLFDGGTTDAGQPWLAMEYIEGVALDEWCRTQQPSLERRLRLFQLLCSAVQHAHRKLIIHRDLTPWNTLARDDDQPVLLDFGVGKLLDEDDSAGVPSTRTRMFTPAYASPEQLRGEPASTLSDIYALGLILFELLTGEPLRQQTGTTSLRLPSRVADAGQPWLRADARLLRGELDNIARKALHDDPYRRYASAAAMAADLQAWFDGHPVTAAADSWAYRLRKFVARHPFAVAATTVTVLVMVLLGLRLAQERRQARREAEGANQAAIFLVDLLKSSSPEALRGEALTVRSLLAQAEQSLATREFSRPALKARLEIALGDIYNSLRMVEPSIPLLQQAIARLGTDDADPRLLAQATRLLAIANVDADRFEEGLRLSDDALALSRRAHGAWHPETGRSLMNLGVAKQHRRRHDEAAAHFQEAQALFAVAGPDYRDNVAAALHNQGWSMYLVGRHVEAETQIEQSLTLKHALLGPNHPSTLLSLHTMAQIELALGRTEAAVDRFTDLLERQVNVLDEASTTVAENHNELASALHDLGRYDQAEVHYRAAIALQEQVGNAALPGYAAPINNLASLHEDQERFDASEAGFRPSLSLRISAGSQPWAVARSTQSCTVVTAYRPARRGVVVCRAGLAIRDGFTPAHHLERLDSLALLARIEHAAGNEAAAQAHLATFVRLLELATPSAGRRAAIHVMLGEFAEGAGDRATAIAEHRTALRWLREQFPVDHPLTASQQIRPAMLLVDGDPDQRQEGFELAALARPTAERHLAESGPTRRRLATLLRQR